MRIAVLSRIFGALLLAGFVAVVGASWLALSELKVNGPIYNRIILGKDLVADVLPPPAYLIESYLEATLISKSPEAYRDHVPKLERLRKEYFERHEFWKKQEQPAPLRKALLETAHQPAVLFWHTIESRLIPALERASAADIAAAYKDLTDAYAAHRKGIDEVVEITSRLNTETEAGAAEEERVYTSVIVAAAVGGIVFILLCVAGVALRLVQPMLSLQSAMTRLAQGDLAVDVPGATRTDELGQMAAAVAHLKQASLDKERMEKEAAEHRRQMDAERAERERERTRETEEAQATIEALAGGLAALARGDLKVRIDAPLPARVETLRKDFNNAVASLRDIMLGILDGASSIRASSGEIATGADDLSRRTEQQAASLEQSVAALGEIATTLKSSAERAAVARDVVSAARHDAEAAGKIVRSTVDAMDGIAKSSRDIGQIIGVIDEIAFQTNLLALNAGVEAARAGEAGRGFAVVASEVRALAQRSAEAAREIKTIISTSSSQVTDGVTLVDQTGEALGRILRQVNEISTVVSAIATGSQDQATGLAEISRAMNQMDEVTQKNAALVEETTAASRSLVDQMSIQLERINRFDLGMAPSGGHRPSPQGAEIVRMTRPAARPPAPSAARREGSALRQPLPEAAEAGWENF
ncbi:MAG: methyl-accepting chemotaxis protein [Hyphomicrobiaceae bacterium]|nr:methyl-accepting chemotaxis protein [Hyphomicrobiaceae bacterium]